MKDDTGTAYVAKAGSIRHSNRLPCSIDGEVAPKDDVNLTKEKMETSKRPDL